MSDYPERLIPKSHYNVVREAELMSQKGLWLIRHVDSDKTGFIGNTRVINPDCIKIQSDHLRDLSNNLLGIFEIDDVCFGIEKDVSDIYCCLWNGSDECVLPDDGHYFKDLNRGYYFIPVDSLLKDSIEIINVNDNTVDEYHFKILHTPTKCNFWHISIRVYDRCDNEVSKLDVSKGKRNRIWKTVRDFLVTSVVTTVIELEKTVSELEPSLYCREYGNG